MACTSIAPTARPGFAGSRHRPPRRSANDFNHCIFPVLQHGIPFGGVGANAMDRYHGHDGFLEMSKPRPVFTLPKIGRPELFYPPYGKPHDLRYRVLNRLDL